MQHSLNLYGFNPNIKLHPPRAERPASQHTFASSNYRALMLAIKDIAHKMSTWDAIRAVEELIKIHAPENWAQSFGKELKRAKSHNTFTSDIAVTSQYLCKFW